MYIYIYKNIEALQPLVLVMAFGLHRGLRPLSTPQKFPDTPKYPEALKNVKKKVIFFLQNFRNFANHFSKNLFPKIFLKKKVLKSPKTLRNIEKMNKKFLEKIRNPS